MLLPADAIVTLSDVQVRAILAHEVAHVRRRDYAVNVFVVVGEGLLFYHPAARWIASRIRAEREFCCDDEAIAVAASSGLLFDRINRIVNGGKPRLTAARGMVALAAATFAAAALLAVSLAVPPGLPWAAVMKRPRQSVRSASTALIRVARRAGR